MREYIVKNGEKLRLGYTTGSCAAAASGAAAFMLLSGKRKESVALELAGGLTFDIEILDIDIADSYVSCAVKKDSGDDPDITNGALIYSRVSKTADGINIDGGKGVGRVTKRGLDQPVGNAAINSTPRRMIEESLKSIASDFGYEGGFDVIISVPAGEELAKKTFNPRLGIEGGISIIGTTGIVEPMSEKAILDTIRIELTQKKEEGAISVLLTPGNYGQAYIKNALGIDPESAVVVSNFIGDSLSMCRELGFKNVLLIGHVGKLVKIAGGMLNTHSKYGDCRMEIISSHAAKYGLKAEAAAEILNCASCDDAIRILRENNLFEKSFASITERISYNLNYAGSGNMQTECILFSNEYGLISESENAEEFLKIFKDK